jgi:hypothetical protein
VEAGQRVGIWFDDDAAKLFLGLTGQHPKSRWFVVGKVAQILETPIGKWIDVEFVLEVRRDGQDKGKRVKHEIRPSLCVIRWDYIISVQLLTEADKPEEIDFRPAVYL